MAHSRNALVLVALATGCATQPGEPAAPDAAQPPAEPACAPAIASSDLAISAIAVDATSIWAISIDGALMRAPLGDGPHELRTFAQVGGGGAHRIVVDDDQLWIGVLGGNDNHGLFRVDTSTGAVDVIDPDLFELAYAIDHDHVYWSSFSAGVVVQPKRGGSAETLVPRTALALPSTIVATDLQLYLVGGAGDASHSHDEIQAFDLTTRSLRLVDTTLRDGTLDLIGPDDAGRIYSLRTSRGLEHDWTDLELWSPGKTSTTLTSWQDGRYLGYEIAAVRDGLYLAAPEAARALTHVTPTGETTAITTEPLWPSELGARFAIGADAAYVLDFRDSTIYRLPLTGGPYPLCTP